MGYHKRRALMMLGANIAWMAVMFSRSYRDDAVGVQIWCAVGFLTNIVFFATSPKED